MPPTKGGVTTFMLNLMDSPISEAFEFIAFTTARPAKRDVIDNWGYGAMLRGGASRVALGALITLWHLIAFPFAVIGRGIDLVQIQASDYQVFWESALYAFMARALRRPVLFRIGGAFDIFQGQSPPAVQRWIGAVLRLPQCVIAQSHFARDYIRSAGRGGEIVVLPNWSRDEPTTRPRQSASAAATFLFIAGMEARRKGIEQVLEAAKLLSDRGSSARFHLLAMTPSLLERVASLKLTNIQAAEGRVGHDRVLALMESTEVLLLPSHGEGFPNTLVEAMAAGMASIVTPVGAVPEMVADGGALVVPVSDSGALAAAIERLAGDAGLRERLGRQAQSILRARYTAAAVLPPLAAAYGRLLASPRLRIGAGRGLEADRP